MKIYVKSNFVDGPYYYDNAVQYYNGNEYMMDYNDETTFVPGKTFDELEAQVTVVHPYDDAEYCWAHIGDGTIDYIKKGKYVAHEDYDDEDEDTSGIFLQAMKKLDELNSEIGPEMLYD